MGYSPCGRKELDMIEQLSTAHTAILYLFLNNLNLILKLSKILWGLPRYKSPFMLPISCL